ncbi:hypothetical protein U9M48_031778 [Paspalum notatum var. saurae]|uniref:Integrase catalytic domain-containing protein n=1 Tax=Paspalum notatum var. saurae TaxID=547442 RepID=A0AAQ3X528_PASNO
MDFIEGLPRVHGKTVILTVVDRFSKFAHFIPLAHPYTATTVARAFFVEIVRLHGIPSSIVSDCDPVFTSAFWRELFHLSGVKLKMSSAFHPQTDGQSEATNKIIAMYLRCLTGDRPRQWVQWLLWVEYCYNSSYQASLGTSPFKVVYGRNPPLWPYDESSAKLPAADQQLRDRDEFLAEIRDRLEQAQQVQKAQHDRGHRELIFAGTGKQLRWISMVEASWDLGSMGHSRCWTEWAKWHIACSCHRPPDCTMYSMWVCRSSILVLNQRRHPSCLLFDMGAHVQPLSRSCVVPWCGAFLNFWCTGRDNRRQMHPGFIRRVLSALSFLPARGRLSRRGEMS